MSSVGSFQRKLKTHSISSMDEISSSPMPSPRETGSGSVVISSLTQKSWTKRRRLGGWCTSQGTVRCNCRTLFITHAEAAWAFLIRSRGAVAAV